MKKLILLLVLLSCLAGLCAQTKRDPNLAALCSALLPGGGQIYNHQYLKAGLVIGVQGFLVGSAIHNDAQRDKYRELANSATDALLQQQYRATSQDYKDRVNNNIWWMGITAALSVIDAYVDANLYDFESEKEKIRLRFGGDQVSLEYRF